MNNFLPSQKSGRYLAHLVRGCLTLLILYYFPICSPLAGQEPSSSATTPREEREGSISGPDRDSLSGQQGDEIKAPPNPEEIGERLRDLEKELEFFRKIQEEKEKTFKQIGDRAGATMLIAQLIGALGLFAGVLGGIFAVWRFREKSNTADSHIQKIETIYGELRDKYRSLEKTYVEADDLITRLNEKLGEVKERSRRVPKETERTSFSEQPEEFMARLEDISKTAEILEAMGARLPHEAYFAMGLNLAQHEDFEGALRHYRKVLDLNPGNAQAKNNLGYVLAQLKRYEEAIHAYEESIELNPDSPYPYSGLGRIFLAQKKYTRAIEEFEKALERNPKYAAAHYYIGSIFFKMEKYEQAIESYHCAIANGRKFSRAHSALGQVYAYLGKFDQAIAEFETAIKMDPRDPKAHLHLGDALGKLGRRRQAEKEFGLALALDPDFPTGPDTVLQDVTGLWRMPERLAKRRS